MEVFSALLALSPTKASDAELWVNNQDAGDLRLHRAHFDITVMLWASQITTIANDAGKN